MATPGEAEAHPRPPAQEPPKKKRKKDKPKGAKSKFWLVKVPNWVAEEWFDDRKYPNGARLGELFIIPNATDPKKKKSMKLTVSPAQPTSATPMSAHAMHRLRDRDSHGPNDLKPPENPLKDFENIPIPPKFKMVQREQRNRVNVKCGQLHILSADKLLVFHDKPPFPVGSKVEALDTSRNHRGRASNAMDTDDDDDADDGAENNNKKKGQTKNKNKNSKGLSSTIKGYAKGVIAEINDDRTFTVDFDGKQRYNVPARDIRFSDPNEAARANKCKIWGVVNGEMDVTPQWTPQYQQFLHIRSMKKSFQHTMQIKEKVDIFKQSAAERERAAAERIRDNKRGDAAHAKSSRSRNEGGKKKRVKNVRKDESVYENMIFAAFEKESSLNQKDVERATGEPWSFLRPVVQKLCDRHKDPTKGGRSWVLKAQFRLASDNPIERPPAEPET